VLLLQVSQTRIAIDPVVDCLHADVHVRRDQPYHSPALGDDVRQLIIRLWKRARILGDLNEPLGLLGYGQIDLGLDRVACCWWPWALVLGSVVS
jgi:hypothetical protein